MAGESSTTSTRIGTTKPPVSSVSRERIPKPNCFERSRHQLARKNTARELGRELRRDESGQRTACAIQGRWLPRCSRDLDPPLPLSRDQPGSRLACQQKRAASEAA